jgi:AraC family transcriptional regulator
VSEEVIEGDVVTYAYEKPFHQDPADAVELGVARGGHKTLADLLTTAAVALETDLDTAKTCIERVVAELGFELRPERSAPAGQSCLRGGFAPWQVKRIRSYIESNLDSTIRVMNLAALVQLSTSHFSRSFHRTFGEPPLAYVTRQRILRAQKLMLSSHVPLVQIALECGMCDQAHFSRVFRRIVGVNPNAWRRQFLAAPPPERVAPIALTPQT